VKRSTPLGRGLLLCALAVPLALALAFEVPLCPMAGLLGIPCPGCGLTRATLALLRGDVADAYHFHPLVFVLGPLYFGALGVAARDFVRGPAPTRPPRFDVTSRTAVVGATALLALVLGVWGARFLGYFGGPVPVRSFESWVMRVMPNALLPFHRHDASARCNR
jgi:hypothetical protein